MQQVLPAVLNALGAYHTALGLKDEAAKDVASATCFSRSKCELSVTLEAVQNSAAQIREEVHERQADDNRLGGPFANAAAEALAPAIPALSDWARLSHALQPERSEGNPAKRQGRDVGQPDSPDKHAAVSRSVRRSAQKVRSSFENTATSIKGAIEYLHFSGVSTVQLEAGLEAALKGD